jgi:dihydroorotase-like cyclic amidohydrolase
MPKLPETIALPGAIDLHVHWRQPGDNKSETIKSGSRAAALGGFVLACDMPNNPGRPTKNLAEVLHKQSIALDKSYIPYATYAGSQPEYDNLGGLWGMSRQCVGLKLYMGHTTGIDKEYQASDFVEQFDEWHDVAPEKPIMVHIGGADLEETIDHITRQRKMPMHLCHVNDPEQVKIVAKAKKEGLNVTCGVCPHHLFMTSHDVFTRGNFAKMQPPLARQTDAEKLFHLLNKGDIDVIETDHAPHSLESKWQAECSGGDCFGVPGSEFAIPLLLNQVRNNRISLERVAEVTSSKPAKILGINLKPDTKVTWSNDIYQIGDEGSKAISEAGWTAYPGMIAVGKVVELTVNDDTIVVGGELIKRSPYIVTERYKTKYQTI